jgi:Cof subfamily protein (haloacid dehalogenase superfamily)
MTKYKLVALDIDGTLANSDGKITTRTKQVVHSVAQTGATIVVATGRRFITAKPRVLQLDFPDLLLAAHNGAVLKRLNGELLHHQLLPCALAKKVVHISQELGLRPVVFEGTQDSANLFVEDYGDRLDGWERGYLEENAAHLKWVDNLATDLPGDVIEVISVVPAAKAHEVAAIFQNRLDGQVKPILVIINNGRHAFLGLSHATVGKDLPLRYLAERMEITPSEILAIGDNYNDLDMLQFAGTGVIMENADEALKQHGFYVTASNDADGVAAALERFVLSGDGV